MQIMDTLSNFWSPTPPPPPPACLWVEMIPLLSDLVLLFAFVALLLGLALLTHWGQFYFMILSSLSEQAKGNDTLEKKKTRYVEIWSQFCGNLKMKQICQKLFPDFEEIISMVPLVQKDSKGEAFPRREPVMMTYYQGLALDSENETGDEVQDEANEDYVFVNNQDVFAEETVDKEEWD